MENRADEAAEVVGEPAEILAGAADKAGGGGAVHRRCIEDVRRNAVWSVAPFKKRTRLYRVVTCAAISTGTLAVTAA